MTKTSSKRMLSIVAIYAIILVVYTLAFLLIPFPKTATSWLSFAFSEVAILCSLAICAYAFKSIKNTLEALYGFPIFRIGLIYMIAQVLVGIVLCVITAFVTVPVWIPLLVSVVMLAIAAICVILASNARTAVLEVEETTAENIKTFSVFNIDVASIIDACENDELKSELQALGNTFKYSSDPVSNEATKAIEDEIQAELAQLKELVVAADIDNAKAKVKQVDRMLAERNRICQANK